MCHNTLHSSLRRSWEQLKLETESTGKSHCTLSGRIMEDLHHQIKEFREQQRDARRKVGGQTSMTSLLRAGCRVGVYSLHPCVICMKQLYVNVGMCVVLSLCTWYWMYLLIDCL